ncbi:MAG: hypothetical protein KC917_05330, partial [Candidatus Omnitrophica bacterium]|nr:hypothetical protein [Candidatus Omnitrophota bacterium]
DVIGLNFLTATKLNPNTSNESLQSLVVEINKVGDSSFTNSDLAPLSGGPDSGIALYYDDGSVDGRFDPDDTFLPLDVLPFYTGENEVFMRLDTPLPLPPRDDFSPGDDFGPDVFVVLRTSGSITQQSVFDVTVRNIRYVNTVSRRTFTTGPIDGGLVNEPPFLELVNPVVGDATNSVFTLYWEDFDPDSNADMDFFYVSEASYQANLMSFDGLTLNSLFTSDGTTRAEGIKEDPDGGSNDSFPWDVSLVNTSKFAPTDPRVAELRVGGVITDGIIDYTDASPSFVTVTNGTPTLKFTNFSGGGITPGDPPTVLQGLAFNVGFTAKDPEGRASADIYLVDETAMADFLTPQANALFRSTSQINSASIQALSPGNVYRVNSSIVEVTQSTTISVPVAGGPGSLSSQLVSGSARTFVALAHIRDIVSGSREFDNGNIISPQPVRITVLPNSPPSFAFTGDLAGGGTAFETDGDDRFQLTWVDSEPDSESTALIDLFYIPPTGGAQQVLRGIPPGSAGPTIPATDISQVDPNDSFTWDLSGLNAGTYRVRGVIMDEIAQDSDEAFVVLNRPSEFSFVNPTQDRTQYSGVSLLIEWTDSNPDFDDDEQIRFFLRNTTTLADIALNTTPISVSDGADRYQASTSSLEPGTYNLFATLTPPPPNSAGLSRTIFAREADNSMVVITLQNNDSPQLVFDPLSLADVVDANPGLSNPTLGGVVSNGNASIPIVWTDMDDAPFTATIRLFAATNVSNSSTFIALQGENPPNPGIVGNQVNLATDNGPGPYPSHGIGYTIGADQDVFFWDISDPNQVPRGNYTIVAIVDDMINPPVQVGSPNTISVNRRPSIAFTSSLSSPITRGDDVTLSWNDSDPDSNARIRIFYQLDNNLDGTPDTAMKLIRSASAIQEDPDGVAFDSFTFDTGSIDPAPPAAFGLFFTITIEDESNSAFDTIPDAGGGVVVNPNDPPSLNIIRPNVENDQEDPDTGFVYVYPNHLIEEGTSPAVVKIEWNMGMDDNVSTTVALYRDNNRFGGDGVPLDQVDILGQDSTAIPLDLTGVFNWDVSEVPAGDWYIYALVDDGVNKPTPIYSPGFIRVNQPPEFEFLDPDGFDDNVFRGQAYNIAWADDDPDSNAIINLFLDPDQNLDNGFGSNVADLNGGDLGLNIPEDDDTDMIPVNTAQLVAGDYWVVAHVDDGVNNPILFQSAFPVIINPTSGGPQITITQPSGGSTTNPFVVTTPTMLVTWEDDPISDARRDQSFIQFFWDTDFFGNNGTILSGTDVAFDGSLINANRIPVELKPTNPPIPEDLRDQDQFEFDVSQFPTGEVIYLYARITDTGVTDGDGVIVGGGVSSEFYQSNAFVINASPTFRWIVPSAFSDPVVNPRGNPLDVIFEAFDPDSTALIDLFLDSDTDSTDGLIPVRNPGQNIPEMDGASSVTLNLADEVPEASVENTDLTFYLLAQITDGVTVTEVYSAPITVTKNLPPEVQVVTPNTEMVVPNEGEFVIEWRDDDPDSDATVSVFLDFDMVGGNGIIVPGTYETTSGVFLDGSAIPEKDDNGRFIGGGVRLDRFLWDLSQTEPGTYFVGVKIVDGANTVFDYSDEPIIVNTPPQFTWINPPPQGAHVVQGDSFDLQWEDEDDDEA